MVDFRGQATIVQVAEQEIRELGVEKMSMGIVSDAEFEIEINKSVQHREIKRGRGSVKEVPEVIREIIAEEVIATDKSQKEIAVEFGVSASSVAAYAHGATSTASYNQPDDKLQKKNDAIRSQIIGSARSRLLSALNHITDDRLAKAKLKDVSAIARDMSAIISHTEPQVSNTNVGAQFIFHVPAAKKESDFETIDVGN